MNLRDSLRLHFAQNNDHNNVGRPSENIDLMPGYYDYTSYSSVGSIQKEVRDDTVELATPEILNPMRVFYTRLTME